MHTKISRFRSIRLLRGWMTQAGIAVLAGTLSVWAQPLPEARTVALKDLNGDFSFVPPADLNAWQKRSAALRLQVQVAMGLLPLPERTPLRPVIHGRKELEGYSVEKVFLEAMPGYFVTGNLYRPLGLTGPFPAVLCPHGHWPDGRFMRASDAEVARELASGGETREEAARSPLQARCVHLARMGCVVFHYDMAGYADSVQLPQALAHGFRARRPAMEAPEQWGFFSAGAESRLQSIMGLQTWSSIRAMDFVSALPEVDAARIGVTGASGGATQTFLLAALDSRVAAMFPAVMVSTGMQGGCTCENASLLRVGTGNVELAALFAPKPAGYTTADDWTRQFATRGFPELQSVYRLYAAENQLMVLDRTEFPHNYNLPSRLAMYQWMARHLKTPRPAPPAESPFALQDRAALSVWDQEHPAPAAGDLDQERQLLRFWDEDARKQVRKDPSLLAQALPSMLGTTWEMAQFDGDWNPGKDRETKAGTLSTSGVLIYGSAGRKLGLKFLYPAHFSGKMVIRLQKAAPEELSVPAVRDTLAAGTAICWPVLSGELAALQGQFPRVEKDRDFVGYTAGYNPLPMALQAQALLSLAAWMRNSPAAPTSILWEVEGPWVPAAALAMAATPAAERPEWIPLDRSFRFAAITDPFDARLLPGAVKYGDLPALLQLGGAREAGGPASAPR